VLSPVVKMSSYEANRNQVASPGGAPRFRLLARRCPLGTDHRGASVKQSGYFYTARYPPSTGSTAPVTQDDSSLAR